MIDLPDHKRPVLQDVQEVVLGVRIGLVNFVQQEDAPVFGQEGPADGPKTEIIPNVVDVPSGIAAAEPGIVQAQHRVIDVAELFALEGGLAAGLFHVQTEGPGDFKGQLGLAGAGLAGEQQRLFHGDGDIDDFPQLGREIIAVGSGKLHPFNSIPNQVIHDGPRSRGGPAPTCGILSNLPAGGNQSPEAGKFRLDRPGNSG